MTTERIIEGVPRRRMTKGIIAEAERHQAFLDGFFIELAADPTSNYARELASDHHFNRNHPNYNPDCFCGSPDDANMDAAAAAVTGFDAPEESWEARQAVTQRKRAGRAMSPNQAAYLQALQARIDNPSIIQAIQAALAGKTTWAEASQLIDRVKQAMSMSVRPNKYPGNCKICGQAIAAEAGHLSKDDRGRWLVEHVEACPEVIIPEATPDEIDEQLVTAAPKASGLDLSSLPAGRYAVPGSDTRLKLQIDKPSKGNWKGYIFVKDAAVYGAGKRYGRQGPEAESRYQGDVQAALVAILADPTAAMAEYGHLTSTCGRCYRALEDAESVERGIGPVCWGRMQELTGE